MNNSDQIETKTATRSGTRIITGIIIAVLVAAGIGTAIWYFAGVVLNETINITEDFSSTKHLQMPLEQDTSIKFENNQNFRYEVASNEESFSKDLSKINYLCPNGLKDKIQSIEINAKNNQPILDSGLTIFDWDSSLLSNTIVVKVNGNEIDLNSNNTNGITLTDYFKNYDSVTWADLIRWSSDSPDTLFLFNNGGYAPVSKGTTNVQAGICEVPSNKLPINLDKDVDDTESFNRITTAGIGTRVPLFSSGNDKNYNNKEFTSGIVLSTDLGSLNRNIGNVTGSISYATFANGTFFSENLQLFFSFDAGDTWVHVPLTQNNAAQEKTLAFNFDLPANIGNHLQYALLYKYAKDASSLNNQPYNQGYTNAVVNNWLQEKQADNSLIDKKVLYLDQTNNTNIVNKSMDSCPLGADLPVVDEQYAHTLMQPFFATNPGIFNYQKVFKCNMGAGILQNMQANHSAIVTLPVNLILNNIQITAKASTTCPNNEELIDGQCTTPLPPGTEQTVCKDDFHCPYGQLRNGCMQECLGPDPNACPEGQTSIDNKCQKAGLPPNEPNLMVDATEFHRNESREILTWKVSDAYKNQNLVFTYGTVDPKNIKTDANGNAILDNQTTAKIHYDKDNNFYYVVLRNLQGGELSDKNDGGFVNGRKIYLFQVSLGDKIARVDQFKTLNRFQTILYYYDIVLSENYNLEKYEQPDQTLRSGGPFFYYKPPQGQEPLSLKGVQYTLLNDKKFAEFDKRIRATQKKLGNKIAVEELYKRIHDRINDDDLSKYFDEAGVNYWTKQIERDDANRIDILGAKFALSVSPEAVGEISKMTGEEKKTAQANQAYEIVLQRGAEKSGLADLKKLTTEKAMREKLAASDEFNNDLKAIKTRQAQIVDLYETLYARAADTAGVNYWDKTGKSIQDIKKAFLSSPEFTKVAQ